MKITTGWKLCTQIRCSYSDAGFGFAECSDLCGSFFATCYTPIRPAFRKSFGQRRTKKEHWQQRQTSTKNTVWDNKR